jgi:hypothetical protein
MTMSAQEWRARQLGDPVPESAGPMDELDNGSCVPAAPSPRGHAPIQPLSSELIDAQNAAAAERHARERGIEARALQAVRRELAREAKKT